MFVLMHTKRVEKMKRQHKNVILFPIFFLTFLLVSDNHAWSYRRIKDVAKVVDYLPHLLQ